MEALTQPHLGFLATGIAGSRVIRQAWLVVAASVGVFLATVPFASTPLVPIPVFVPVYVSSLVFCDLITAVLLFSQFAVLRSWSLLVLGGGYFFTGTATLAYLFIFPGLFTPTGLFGAGPQTSSAMYMFWHAGLPLFVMAYRLLQTRASARGRFEGRPVRAILGLGAAVVVGTVGFTAFATAGNGLLPEFLLDNHTTLVGHLFLLGVWALSLAALLVLWFRRSHTILDVWLMVVLGVWLCDLGLSALLNGGRYDLGWYVGRLNGLVASSFLLVLLLIESGRSYSRLLGLSVELQNANATLERLSLQDGLTGLANRRSFDLFLEEQITVARRHGRTLALVLVDVDHFKAYNDSYGHQAGDECLRRVASSLGECCRRPTDKAARYGGEEFALILPDTEAPGAWLIAETARNAVLDQKIPHANSVTSPYVTISGGIAIVSAGEPATAEQLIAAADKALYLAKQAGRNRMVPA